MTKEINNLPATNKERLRRHKMMDAALQNQTNLESAIAFKQRELQSDPKSVLNSNLKRNASRKAANKLESLKADKFVECLSRSLGHVVALATDIVSEDTSIKTQIAESSTKIFRKLIESGKVKPESVFAKDAPHLALYINTIKNISDYQSELMLDERTEDKEYLENNIQVAESYEKRLSDVLRVKDRIVLNEERKLQEEYEAAMAYANESAKFPDAYKAKIAKKFNSYFRTIMDAHAEAYLKVANEGSTVDKKQIATEAMITYNILELLHTSKLAPKAELSFVF